VRVLLLDNYDSFTWNLAHYLEELGAEVDVRLNDEVSVDWVLGQGFAAWVVSPGPGRPEESGITLDLVRRAGPTPLLGVCLGHQALALVHGAEVVRAPAPVHGKTSRIRHDGRGVFGGLPPDFDAMRYHSLAVDPRGLPPELTVCARSEDGVVMGLRHATLPLHGVQFHPESVLTLRGQALLGNFLRLAAEWNRASGPLPGTSIGGK
jgi:anthranilate synthase component 2